MHEIEPKGSKGESVEPTKTRDTGDDSSKRRTDLVLADLAVRFQIPEGHEATAFLEG